METITYKVVGSHDFPLDVRAWLEEKIDASKLNTKELIANGMIGEGRRRPDSSPLKPFTFQVYFDGEWERFVVFWNDGFQNFECQVSLWWTKKTTHGNHSFDAGKFSHAECACG